MVDRFIMGRQSQDIASFFGMKQQLAQTQVDQPMVVEQDEEQERQHQYTALLQSQVLGIDDPMFMAQQHADTSENNPLSLSNRSMNVFKTPDKILSGGQQRKKKAVYH